MDKKLNKEPLFLRDGTKVYVNSAWLYSICLKYARDKISARGGDHANDMAYGKSMLEAMSKDTELNIVRTALLDVRKSEIESSNIAFSNNVRMLSILQEKITKGECETGKRIDISVSLVEGKECCPNNQFKVVYNDLINICEIGPSDAESTIRSLLCGSGVKDPKSSTCSTFFYLTPGGGRLTFTGHTG